MTDYSVRYSRETDGRWIADIPALPGCLVYGDSQEDAREKALALAREIVADERAHGERDA